MAGLDVSRMAGFALTLEVRLTGLNTRRYHADRIIFLLGDGFFLFRLLDRQSFST
jgi:hypothetical protein